MSTPAPEKVTFEHLIGKVRHAEDALESHEHAMGEQNRRLKQAWKAAWTPGRVISAGLVTGFLVGRAEPLAKVGGARWMQMITTVSGMFASIQAAVAAGAAEDAAEDAEDAGHEAAVAGVAATEAAAAVAPAASAAGSERLGPSERVRSARPHTGEWTSQPRPAEAATEVSEPRRR